MNAVRYMTWNHEEKSSQSVTKRRVYLFLHDDTHPVLLLLMMMVLLDGSVRRDVSRRSLGELTSSVIQRSPILLYRGLGARHPATRWHP